MTALAVGMMPPPPTPWMARPSSSAQKLVDKAWSTTFESEKEALLAKADALMLKYSLDQFALLDPSRATTAPIKGQEPEMRVIHYFGEELRTYDEQIMSTAHTIFYHLATHTGCRVGSFGWSNSKVVGYPADLDFLEMLVLSLKLDLLKRVDPQIVPEITWELNLVALKQAGRKWTVIHEMLEKHPNYKYRGQAWSHSIGVSFTAVYKRWRDANPDEPHNVANPTMWRRDFMDGYATGIVRRLRDMRAASVQENKNLPALIADKTKSLDDLYNELWPPVEIKSTSTGKGRVQRYRAPKQRAFSAAAQAAGLSAAAKADLSDRSGRVGNSTRGEIG